MLPEALIATWNESHHPREMIETLSSSSGKRLWWQCERGHEWQAVVADRSKGQGCPYCAGRKVMQGFNDICTTHPHLLSLWHPTKNTLKPTEVSHGSRKFAWWQCEQGHEWEETLKKVSGGRRCPYCAGKRVLQGSTDLATTHADLAEQWHPTKNEGLTPSQIKYGSTTPVWWQCSEGHEWNTSPNRRKNRGCPICAGKEVLVDFNDLLSTYPNLSQEWHPTLNGSLMPTGVTKGSKKIWWRCANGHEWCAVLSDRTRADAPTGCPTCAFAGISKMEIEVAEWVASLGVTVKRNVRNILPSLELDIYLPNYDFAIEFNGLYWHSEAGGKTKDYHRVKSDAARQAGITLFQVWEDDWRDRQSIVKRMLLHRLGLSSEPVVFARKAQVVRLTSSQAHPFLEEHHLQGKASGGLYVGLQVESTLVAVMVFKKMGNGVVYLERYATSCRVPGGFTKLLKHAISILTPTAIITFADCSISQGELYEKTGFVTDKILDPDYSYLVKGTRVHKFNYRIKRFRDDPALQYEEGLSEAQLARLNKLYRIWDSGKIRYVLTP